MKLSQQLICDVLDLDERQVPDDEIKLCVDEVVFKYYEYAKYQTEEDSYYWDIPVAEFVENCKDWLLTLGRDKVSYSTPEELFTICQKIIEEF